MRIDRAHILVLNYNGEGLLAECLPSVFEAARRAPVPCGVSVIDNDSTDRSVPLLRATWPELPILAEPNRGLASFNAVLARRDEPVVLLLNNDVKLGPDAVGPLLQAFDADPNALFAAPLCWDFDGATYEGMRTRVRMRYGLVQGLCRVPGHRETMLTPGWTAAAGPVLAVDRRKFLELGGYDPLYFPGRLEDLDLGFRGWARGWHGLYVPESVAYHRGFGSFGPAFGARGCDRLAWRNSLLFAWKNLRGRRLLEHCAWLPPRLAYAFVRGRFDLLRSFLEALGRLGRARSDQRRFGMTGRAWRERQDAFFREFAW